MKGLVFNVAEEVITELYDADVWDTLLESAGLDGAYTSLGNYEDAEIEALVAAAASLLDFDIEDTWRVLGRHMLPRFVERVKDVAAEFDGGEQLLRSVNDIIHPNVKVLYPDAAPPIFKFSDTDAGLLVRYQSDRGLAALAEGLIIGTGDLYGELVEVERLEGHSDFDCYFAVTYSKPSD